MLSILRSQPITGRRKSITLKSRLSFQQIDLDKIIEYRDGEPVPVIRIFGADENGSSVACFVQNFKPYFYVKAPKGMSHDYTDQFMQALNGKMMENIKTGGQYQGMKKAVLGVELCKKENIYGYSSKEKFKKYVDFSLEISNWCCFDGAL